MISLTSLYSIISSFIRSAIKFILHRVTNLCELQRLCYSTLPEPNKTLKIEKSLQRSKCPEITRIVKIITSNEQPDDISGYAASATKIIMRCKRIDNVKHALFETTFPKYLEHICHYNNLIDTITRFAKTAYNSENIDHEKKLLRLWELLMKDEELTNRISRQWEQIGFQGDNPETDFRGMGILSLDNMLYYSEKYNTNALNSLNTSIHPVSGYCFAIVGINLTQLAYFLLKDGDAKYYFYNGGILPTVNWFREFYSLIFAEFNEYWILSNPTNLMDFPIIRKQFESYLRSSLKNTSASFYLKQIK